MERISNESTGSEKDFFAYMLDDLMYFLNEEKNLRDFLFLFLKFEDLKIRIGSKGFPLNYYLKK